METGNEVSRLEREEFLLVVPKILSREEVCTLIEDARKGNKRAEKRIFDAYARLVRKIAQRLARRGIANYVPFDDLEQEGTLGLWDAIKRFEPQTGALFEAYATHRIRGAMLDAVRGQSSVSRTMARAARDAESIRMRLAHELLREPTLVEWKAALPAGLREKFEEIRIFQQGNEPQSLTQINDTHDVSLEELVATNEGRSIEDEIEAGEEQRYSEAFYLALKRACSRLDEREKEIIFWRYQAPEDEILSLADLGRRLGVSESRVCQLEAQALKAIRRYLRMCYREEVAEELEKISQL